MSDKYKVVIDLKETPIKWIKESRIKLYLKDNEGILANRLLEGAAIPDYKGVEIFKNGERCYDMPLEKLILIADMEVIHVNGEREAVNLIEAKAPFTCTFERTGEYLSK